MRISIAVLVVAVLLVSCGRSSGGTPEPGPQGAWQLVAGSPMVEGWPITLSIEEESVGGVAACNSYFGTVIYDEAGIAFSQLGRTEMGCQPEVMEAERIFLERLQAMERWELDAERLVLTGGGFELVFEVVPPIPTADLVGTTWELETLVRGETASTTHPGTSPVLTLHEDGTFEGTTGCRRLTGSWVEAGGEVVMVEMTAHGECDPAVAEQDDLIVAVLGDGFRPEIDGDRLEISSSGGEGLVYRAAE